ncbi:DNA-binding transcriptional regulator, MarR family [Paenibacillus sp. CF095]|uniref:MarR family winged helix-turn-helix transcriptional regulator n=1 Tax=Paenibacillus sp. CF095 TaxID=1881033 RepID=UPI00088AA353|nr:MarR family transcriptional regulator [Paenibacillus sp. CF095]SDC24655.1 DNA-binding transcriptional regulator, MarR family [Paenibacillus sp. CF095]
MSENPVKTKDRATLELALGEQIHALISASHALNVRSAERFDANLQPAAFQLVRWLYSHGPTSAAALAEANAMDRSSVSRLIKQLEKSGYVSKEQDPKDRRGVLLSLTELGQQSTVGALKEKESAFYDGISRWDDKELELFTAMLRQFNGLEEK